MKTESLKNFLFTSRKSLNKEPIDYMNIYLSDGVKIFYNPVSLEKQIYENPSKIVDIINSYINKGFLVQVDTQKEIIPPRQINLKYSKLIFDSFNCLQKIT